ETTLHGNLGCCHARLNLGARYVGIDAYQHQIRDPVALRCSCRYVSVPHSAEPQHLSQTAKETISQCQSFNFVGNTCAYGWSALVDPGSADITRYPENPGIS